MSSKIDWTRTCLMIVMQVSLLLCALSCAADPEPPKPAPKPPPPKIKVTTPSGETVVKSAAEMPIPDKPAPTKQEHKPVPRLTSYTALTAEGCRIDIVYDTKEQREYFVLHTQVRNGDGFRMGGWTAVCIIPVVCQKDQLRLLKWEGEDK